MGIILCSQLAGQEYNTPVQLVPAERLCKQLWMQAQCAAIDVPDTGKHSRVLPTLVGGGRGRPPLGFPRPPLGLRRPPPTAPS